MGAEIVSRSAKVGRICSGPTAYVQGLGGRSRRCLDNEVTVKGLNLHAGIPQEDLLCIGYRGHDIRWLGHRLAVFITEDDHSQAHDLSSTVAEDVTNGGGQVQRTVSCFCRCIRYLPSQARGR